MDAKAVNPSPKIPSGYEIQIHGGRTYTGIDALWWAKKAESLGAGQAGYELNLTKLISENVSIPVIASGGAGVPEHLYEVCTKAKADAALIASMVHYGTYTIREIKEYLYNKGLRVRMVW